LYTSDPRVGDILITGATGFAGSHVIKTMQQLKLSVRTAGRRAVDPTIPNHQANEINGHVDWRRSLDGTKAVVYLAGLAHRTKQDVPTSQYFEINKEAPVELARQACEMGVARFIYLSTAKVYGEENKRSAGGDLMPFSDLQP